MEPAEWDQVDDNIRDAMRRIERLSARTDVTGREKTNLWRVLTALNHARAELHDGRKLCENAESK